AKYQVIHFKNKVLDLLEIFIRKQPSNPLVFNLILPLLDVALKTNSSSDQVANKARGLLVNKLCKSKKYPEAFTLDDEDHSEEDDKPVLEILKEVHQLAKKASSNLILEACSNLCGYLAKALIRYYENLTNSKTSKNTQPSSQLYSKIIEIYRESLNDFMIRKKSRLNTGFFYELTRFPEVSWLLIDDLLEFTTHPEKVQNVFRFVQSYEMTSKFVKVLIAKKSSDHDQILLDFVPKYEKSLLRTFDYILSSSSYAEKDNASNDRDNGEEEQDKSKSQPSSQPRTPTNSSIWQTKSTNSLEQALVSIRDRSCYKSSSAVKDLVNHLLKNIRSN
ncbi:13601_t:CDS:2, partial [Ambispora leptoticha]